MRRLLALTMLLLAACGTQAPVAVPDDDPALAAALAGPILTDPDLVGQNRANSAVALPSQDNFLPSVDAGPEAIDAARNEALELVGGPGRMRRAPDPEELKTTPPAKTSHNLTELAAATAGLRAFCGQGLQQTAMWAARMPAAFPVYPRGAVQQAAGTDRADCKLRAIEFVTPVPLDEVVDFYYTRAAAAGFSAKHSRGDDEAALTGNKSGAVYDIHFRRLPSGNTAVDLLTSG
jgi:hypothetical protein